MVGRARHGTRKIGHARMGGSGGGCVSGWVGWVDGRVRGWARGKMGVCFSVTRTYLHA